MFQYNYDYSQTMWMKFFMARPDFANGTSKVYINYEQALALIKAIDAITQGVKKIVYLVGWQRLGHDDGYPEMQEYNEFLKRPCDTCAKDSYRWLFEEAKKYNTVVSVHVNLADCYDHIDSFGDIVKANAVCQHPDGTPAVIEVFNGRPAYKICYKAYYESGIFKKLWDRFTDTVPVKEAGTVHIDNFCVAENRYTGSTCADEVEGRNRMLDYIIDVCGIDVTTEYTYRELPGRADKVNHPIHAYYGNADACRDKEAWKTAPMHTLGRIAASWWTECKTPEECVQYPANVYAGHIKDKELAKVLYGTVHGEDIFHDKGTDPENWAPDFIKEFATYQVPYFYLNNRTRLSVDPGEDGTYTMTLSDGVKSCGSDRSITKNGLVLKRGNDTLLPLDKSGKVLIGYSENGRSGPWNVPDATFSECDIFALTPAGNRFITSAKVENGKIHIDVQPGQGIAVIGK